MTKLPPPINSIANLIDAHHAAKEDRPRAHLGCSGIGHPCDRWIWLSFRWAVREVFPGRIKRLFRRGNNEEAIMVADLKAIGVDIRETGRDQRFVKLGSHVSGSIDGIIESGVPEAMRTRHIAEFKTHSLKSFKDLEKGVRASKPMHWAQMQAYMFATKIDRALYVAVCKDDDSIYTERVNLDRTEAARLVERAQKIALAERMPDPLSTDPSWYACKFCPAHSFCHTRQMTEHVNCRTCARSTPEADSTWSCAKWDAKDIPTDFQHAGCDAHVLHPDLVPWPIKDSGNPDEAVYIINGVEVRNGENDAFTFSSKELIAGGEACAAEIVGAVKQEFPGAKVTGVQEYEVPF